MNLEDTAAQARLSRQALEDAIRQQHTEGMSLRKLAELTGMSHETVRRICSKDPNPGVLLSHPNPEGDSD